MPMSLSGTDGLLPGALKPLLDKGRGRNSVNRDTQSPEEGHSFFGELDALRWIEENVTKYRDFSEPTVESIHAIGDLSCSRLRVCV